MSKIYVVGETGINILARNKEKTKSTGAAPAKIEISLGGMGRNIAENLCFLEESPVFITAFANDVLGKMIFKECKSLGMDLGFSEIVDGVNTSAYLNNLQSDGKTYVQMNDISAILAIDKVTIGRLVDTTEDDDIVIIDSNLEQESYEYAFEKLKGRKMTYIHSLARAKRMLKIINRVSILIIDEEEAEAICGMSLDDEVRIISFMKLMNQLGVEEVILSLNDRVYIGVHECVYSYAYDSWSGDVLNVNNAKESIISAYAYARLHNASIESSTILSMICAFIRAKNPNIKDGITKADIKEELGRTNITGGVIYKY